MSCKRRYIDIAIDAVLATMHGPAENKFCWTAEALIAIRDWWLAATPDRRNEFGGRRFGPVLGHRTPNERRSADSSPTPFFRRMADSLAVPSVQIVTPHHNKCRRAYGISMSTLFQPLGTLPPDDWCPQSTARPARRRARGNSSCLGRRNTGFNEVCRIGNGSPPVRPSWAPPPHNLHCRGRSCTPANS